MRALVTGAAGFIGSYLTRVLLRERATVAVVLRPGSDAWRIREVLPSVRVIRGDLRQLAEVRSAILDFAPETVFHLAWHGVMSEHRNAIDQIEANLEPSLELFRIGVAAGCGAWVGLGSQAEYGPANCLLDEETPTRPSTTYGVVKLCVGLLTERLAREAGIRHAWVRVFSTYGPGDHPSWLISYLIGELLKKGQPRLTGCEQLWDYLHVADAAEALYRVSVESCAEGVLNLGSGQAYRLRGIVEQIRDMIDPALPLGFGEVPYRPDQVMHLQADISKIRRLTGWEPRIPLAEGLRQTVEWFRGAKQSLSTVSG